MGRSRYKIFSPGAIAGMTVPNRLVRSATWDPCILSTRQMTEEVLALYRSLALGGIGLLISGGLPVYRDLQERQEAASHGSEVACHMEEKSGGVDIKE